jgi:DNA-binding NarL/FixJ family response regulator
MDGARPDELRGLVSRAMEIARERGLFWLSTSAREFASRAGLASGDRSTGTVLADELSGPEREVLEVYARGNTIPQIAAALLLHERTVEAHLERARRRLGIATASQAKEYLGGEPAVQSPAGRATGRLAELTRRELEVLGLVAQGRTNQQIADELVISLHTAIRHVANILEKTGSANRVEAARLAAEARK